MNIKLIFLFTLMPVLMITANNNNFLHQLDELDFLNTSIETVVKAKKRNLPFWCKFQLNKGKVFPVETKMMNLICKELERLLNDNIEILNRWGEKTFTHELHLNIVRNRFDRLNAAIITKFLHHGGRKHAQNIRGKVAQKIESLDDVDRGIDFGIECYLGSLLGGAFEVQKFEDCLKKQSETSKMK